MLASVTLAPLTGPAEVGAKVTVNGADCPGVKIMPLETPLVLNPAPFVVTLEIVMFEFPLLVIDVDSELLLPSFTLPKERLVGLTPSDSVWADPVPDRPIVSDDGVPLVAKVMLPLADPEADGVNTALNMTLLPATIVLDVESPVWLKPVPDTVTCEKVSVALPLFLRVIGCELLFPTLTAEKLTLDGFADICACVPVPVRLITKDDGVPLVASVMLPLTAVADDGANMALKLKVPPAEIVEDVESPVWLMPLPATLICEKVSVEVPPFVSVTGTEPLLPKATFPKLTLDGLAEICGCGCDGA